MESMLLTTHWSYMYGFLAQVIKISFARTYNVAHFHMYLVATNCQGYIKPSYKWFNKCQVSSNQ